MRYVLESTQNPSPSMAMHVYQLVDLRGDVDENKALLIFRDVQQLANGNKSDIYQLFSTLGEMTGTYQNEHLTIVLSTLHGRETVLRVTEFSVSRILIINGRSFRREWGVYYAPNKPNTSILRTIYNEHPRTQTWLSNGLFAADSMLLRQELFEQLRINPDVAKYYQRTLAYLNSHSWIRTALTPKVMELLAPNATLLSNLQETVTTRKAREKEVNETLIRMLEGITAEIGNTH